MTDIKINFSSHEIDEDENQDQPSKFEIDPEEIEEKPRGRWKKVLLGIALVAIIFFAVFSSSIAFSNESLIKNLAKLNPLDSVGKIISSSDKQIKGEENDRINVLVMGIGGANHDGGTLADTIILGSLKPSTNQAALMSIPRDLSIQTADHGWMKINAVSAWAEKANPGSGGAALQKELNTLLATDIPYYIVIDFDGFEKLIDEFGGVDVTVDNDFVDYQYPIRDKEDVYPIANRYEVLRFKKGPQHMDGATALKYARSRHALGPEGSDFARSVRQQKVITGLKEKIFSLQTLISPQRINSLLTAYNEHIKTNMQIWEIIRLATLAKKVDRSQIINHGLSNAPDGLLYSTMINSAYVLLPDDNTYNDIRNLWAYIFYTETQVSHTKKHPDDYDALRKQAIASSTSSTTSSTTVTSTIDTSLDDNEDPFISTTPTPESIKPTSTSMGTGIKPEVAGVKIVSTTKSTTTVKTSTSTVTKLPTTTSFKKEGATIEIQNGTTISGLAGSEKTKLVNQGFIVTKTGNAVDQTRTTSIVYDLSGGKYPATSLALAKIYGSVSTKKPIGISSSANFLVIIGK